jgi:hypothetical protein
VTVVIGILSTYHYLSLTIKCQGIW